MRDGHSLHVRQLCNGPCGEALVYEPIVHEHVGDTKQRNAETGTETQAARQCRSEEAIEAQAHGRDRIDDGIEIVGLQEAAEK